jgi:hypothetical protein
LTSKVEPCGPPGLRVFLFLTARDSKTNRG